MSNYSAHESDYQGEKAITLKAGRYEAIMLYEIGGNLMAFRDTVTGSRFLHEPDGMDALEINPYIYGIPVLIPPNRYEDGKLRWNNDVIQLPINEAATGNHLHGYVHGIPWRLDAYGANEIESYVVVSLTVDSEHPVYSTFPFSFTIRLKYTLSDFGLHQQVFIRNNGESELPCLLAFHTTLNAPFHPQGSAKECRLKMTLGQRWEMNERMLPTGDFQLLSQEEEAMKGEGIYPYFASMDNHYTAVPQNGRNRIELQDRQVGCTLVYDVGTSYKQWMIWNNNASEGFFSAEPQINLVNAPNTDLPAEEIGLFSLKPGEIWEETARMYLR
jgi:aldose 1-epimerase